MILWGGAGEGELLVLPGFFLLGVLCEEGSGDEVGVVSVVSGMLWGYISNARKEDCCAGCYCVG